MTTRTLYFRDLSVDAARLLLEAPPLAFCPFVAWHEQDNGVLRVSVSEPGPSTGEETLIDVLAALSTERHMLPDLARWQRLDVDTRSLALTALGMALGFEPARLIGVTAR